MAVAGLLVHVLLLLAEEVSHVWLWVASPSRWPGPAVGGRPQSGGAPATAAMEREGARRLQG